MSKGPFVEDAQYPHTPLSVIAHPKKLLFLFWNSITELNPYRAVCEGNGLEARRERGFFRR